MITSWPTLLIIGLVLCLIQFLAAVPWQKSPARPADPGNLFLQFLVCIALGTAGIAVSLSFLRDKDYLAAFGRFYGGLLNFQLLLDVLVIGYVLLLWVWPKGGVVALAAFAEGIRQPMFWFLLLFALFLMLLMPFLPYFTFGEDLKMVKELGYDTIMLFAGLFGVLAASMSISEEIEGRTAVTLMSKPVSRRQFLLGKFAGIFSASMLMAGLLSLAFFVVVWFKPIYEKGLEDPPPPPEWVEQWVGKAAQLWPSLGENPVNFLRGVLGWIGDAVAASPGLILGCCQVMVLLAIAVALATRLPMVVNLVVGMVVFFLGHLTPVLAQVSRERYALVRFMAQLFDTLLPALDYFNIGPVLTRELPPIDQFSIYIASVALYSVLYTAIALLFGLILFEDRDLA